MCVEKEKDVEQQYFIINEYSICKDNSSDYIKVVLIYIQVVLYTSIIAPNMNS